MFTSSSIPWNKDRSVGPRTPLEIEEIQQIEAHLLESKSYRDLVLFTVGLDSMLRVSDLRKLKVRDMWERRKNNRLSIPVRQQKTGNNVRVDLMPETIGYVDQWIAASGKSMNDYLFTSFRKGWESRPLSESRIRAMVKKWVAMIGLDPATYSAHSLRRSKPTILYQSGIGVELIYKLLGHADARCTSRYLGIGEMEAQEAARSCNLYRMKPLSHYNQYRELSGFSVAQKNELDRLFKHYQRSPQLEMTDEQVKQHAWHTAKFLKEMDCE